MQTNPSYVDGIKRMKYPTQANSKGSAHSKWKWILYPRIVAMKAAFERILFFIRLIRIRYTQNRYIYIYTFLFIAQFRMGRINARIYTYIEMLTSIESHKYCHPTCSPKRCNTIHSFISLKRLACIFPYRMSVGFFVAVEQHAHVSCLDGHLLIATILHAFYTQ